MRMTRWIVSVLIAAAVGCGGSSSSNNNSDGGTTTPAASEQLTAFAGNLIATETTDDSTPTVIASLTFAEDNEDPNAFPPAFFL